jgi:hypothetical protein
VRRVFTEGYLKCAFSECNSVTWRLFGIWFRQLYIKNENRSSQSVVFDDALAN